MRIAVIHSFYSSAQPSGENGVVVDQVAVLREAGHEVELFARHTDDERKSFLYPFKAAARVGTGLGADPTDRLRAFAPDVVHVHNLFPNIGTSWTRRWSGPIVVSVHNYRLVCSNGLLFRNGATCLECPQLGPSRAIVHRCYRESAMATIPLALSRHRDQRRLLLGADAVVTTSRGSDELLKSVVSVPIRTVVIPNFGADDGHRPLPTSDREGWVALGRLAPEKGLLDLARDWPAGERLTVIGDGPQADELRQVADRGEIQYLPSMSRSDLRVRLPHFTGLVFPSVWAEAAPQVAVEAMRVGLPIVALDRNVVSDVVRDSGAGVVYSGRNDLAEALVAVAHDCEAMSEKAALYYAATWRPSIWLEATEALYTSLIEERRV
jgi:glycosyltransferase involved in cell wall biosynthesis